MLWGQTYMNFSTDMFSIYGDILIIKKIYKINNYSQYCMMRIATGIICTYLNSYTPRWSIGIHLFSIWSNND